MSEDFAARMATLRPRETGPGENLRLQVSSRMATRRASSALLPASHSQAPSAEPPSTTMTSAAGGFWASRLAITLSMSSASLSSVRTILTGLTGALAGGMGEVYRSGGGPRGGVFVWTAGAKAADNAVHVREKVIDFGAAAAADYWAGRDGPPARRAEFAGNPDGGGRAAHRVRVLFRDCLCGADCD